MNINQDRLLIRLLPDSELHKLLASLEAERFAAIDLLGSSREPHVEYLTLLLDAVAGEIIHRQKLRNPTLTDEQQRFLNNLPKQALVLKPDSDMGKRKKLIQNLGLDKTKPVEKMKTPSTYWEFQSLGDGSADYERNSFL
jgi:hypothetical protein